MFNIEEFRATVNQRGMARTNRYLLQLALPATLNNVMPQSEQRDITLRAESVQWPGYSFIPFEVPTRLGYGPGEVYPYVPLYDDITITFLVDKHMDVYNLFYEWMNLIVNTKNEGQSKYGTQNGISGARPYELTYRDEYVGNGILTVIDPSNKTVMTANIYRMWPRAIPSIDMSYGAENDVMRIAIPFNYADFTIQRGNIPRTSLNSAVFNEAFSDLGRPVLDTSARPGAVDVTQINPPRG